MNEINRLFDHLLKSVREAGDIALRHFGKDIRIEQKPDGSKVSEADLAVNDFLKQTLTDAAPNYAWLSEESPISDERINAPYIWIIDPIDGTSSFLNHQPEWTIVASLVQNNTPLMGVVYNPVKSELFSAMKNQGAHLNGAQISINKTDELDKAHIITSKSHFNRTFQNSYNQPGKRSWVNSMAYRIALVANGTADATISLTPKNDWDIAAAHLILEEAGGKISTPIGEKLEYNKLITTHTGIVAASTRLYKQIIDLTSDKN